VVRYFLQPAKLKHLQEIFEENRVDGKMFLNLTDVRRSSAAAARSRAHTSAARARLFERPP
jgi:hypothetical protein